MALAKQASGLHAIRSAKAENACRQRDHRRTHGAGGLNVRRRIADHADRSLFAQALTGQLKAVRERSQRAILGERRMNRRQTSGRRPAFSSLSQPTRSRLPEAAPSSLPRERASTGSARESTGKAQAASAWRLRSTSAHIRSTICAMLASMAASSSPARRKTARRMPTIGIAVDQNALKAYFTAQKIAHGIAKSKIVDGVAAVEQRAVNIEEIGVGSVPAKSRTHECSSRPAKEGSRVCTLLWIQIVAFGAAAAV